MAGHSQFKNIMHRKGAQDKKRARLFTRLGRELMVAARAGGTDPNGNPRLRSAILTARSGNMPKDNIDRAIAKGAGTAEGAAFEETRYEGFGTGGVGVIVETLTDNRNRTAAEIRSLFSKHGGTMAENGAVSCRFDRVGEVCYPAAVGDAESVFEAAAEAGAEDAESDVDGHRITSRPEALHMMADGLEGQLGAPLSVALVWRPQALMPLSEEDAPGLFRLIEALESNDDVQSVAADFAINDAALKWLTTA